MTVSIPVEVHETEYHLDSYGKGTTEFSCSHIHYHKEEIEGEMFDKSGLMSYRAYAYVCDNEDCQESIENILMEDGCNE